jgi:hypothetical protein
MDEQAFRAARRTLNPHPCPFEQALLARCCDCSLALRHDIGGRQTIACRSEEARGTCTAARTLLRRNSSFALRVLPDEPVPQSKEIKSMCGGLRGLQDLLQQGDRIEDVRGLLVAAQQAFGSLEALPFRELMPFVAAFEPRRRRGI